MDHVRGAGAEATLTETAEGSVGMTLRLLICDPHHLFRECLATALARDRRFEVVDRADTGPTLLSRLACSPANVLVLGTDLLDRQLIDLTREIAALFPRLKVLVLGRAESDEQVVACLLAGAGGFLLRDQSLAEVATAIEVVARGDRVCPPGATRLLFERLGELGRERKRRDRLEVLELSAREMEILRLISDGLTNQQIAGRLYLSVHTIKNHIHRILDVLGVHNRWEAVNHAFAKGWLQAGDGALDDMEEVAPTISVMILGGDRVFAEALEAVLAAEEGFRLCAAPAGDQDPPAILLIDASFDPAETLALTWSARERFPAAQVMILGVQAEDDSLLELIEAGAAAYLLQSASPAQLVEALRFLREGQVQSSPRIAAAVVERIATLERDCPAVPLSPSCEPLTARELETLALLARGLRNKEIAHALHITVQTVKNHVHSILLKLQVHRRRDAVRSAYERGLLREPGPLDLF